MKKVFAVLGDPVSHSLSPVMHNAAFNALGLECEYLAFRVGKERLGDAIRGAAALGFGGLNLTIPLKEKALEVVDADAMAEKIGAVNTVDFSGGIRGYNTDGLGAMRALAERGVGLRDAEVVLAGAGGAARGIAFHLVKAGARVTIVNRTEDRAASLAAELHVKSAVLSKLPGLLEKAGVLINSTSVGMTPNIEETIATSDMMHPGLTVFDIVYNPVDTKLLREARKAGAAVIDGVKMLVYQGAESFRIWTGKTPPVDIMEAAVRRRLG
ncbi:MAG TPA: shikimate dehydrogenase [Candidatus Methanoperedenaceae archaeon]|nr:shikimate dehydrogenase [Candidatus Methanoperedenaceae archaeon]